MSFLLGFLTAVLVIGVYRIHARAAAVDELTAHTQILETRINRWQRFWSGALTQGRYSQGEAAEIVMDTMETFNAVIDAAKRIL